VKAGKLKQDFKALLIVTHPARKAAPAPVAPVATPAPQPQPTPAPQPAPTPVAAPKPAPKVEAPQAAPKPATPSVADQVGKALEGVNWEAVSGRALTAATGAAAAASKVKGVPAKMLTFIRYIKDNTGIDEALIEFVRTFVTVSISVALGLGIPLLDISGGDFRTVLSAGLASGLQVLVKYLDPKNSAFGIKEKP